MRLNDPRLGPSKNSTPMSEASIANLMRGLRALMEKSLDSYQAPDRPQLRAHKTLVARSLLLESSGHGFSRAGTIVYRKGFQPLRAHATNATRGHFVPSYRKARVGA
jgi:hypothetical protein